MQSKVMGNKETAETILNLTTLRRSAALIIRTKSLYYQSDGRMGGIRPGLDNREEKNMFLL
jgi:hypothetical protein